MTTTETETLATLEAAAHDADMALLRFSRDAGDRAEARGDDRSDRTDEDRATLATLRAAQDAAHAAVRAVPAAVREAALTATHEAREALRLAHPDYVESRPSSVAARPFLAGLPALDSLQED
jgi:hypothetical protein